jgi:acetolactate synthase-1/2/3 large subunit
VKWAEAMGCVGLRATNLKEMDDVIDEANKINDVPVVIDFRTDSSEKVFPMVASGASNDDIIVHPSQQGRAR